MSIYDPFKGPLDGQCWERATGSSGSAIPGVNNGYVPANAWKLVGIKRQALEVVPFSGLPSFWQAPFDLLPHQKKVPEVTKRGPGAVRLHMWSPTGSGKTATALAWSAPRIAAGYNLVIVTRSAAICTWENELRNTMPGVPMHRCEGRLADPRKSKSHTEMPPPGTRIYLIAWENIFNGRNTDIILSWAAYIAQHIGKYVCVFDEIHEAKNHQTTKMIVHEDGTKTFEPLQNRQMAATVIANHASCRLGLTATPIPNTFDDVYGQLKLVSPLAWGSHHAFCSRYMQAQRGDYGFVYSGEANRGEFSERVRCETVNVRVEEFSAMLPALRREVYRYTSSQLDKPLKKLEAPKSASRQEKFEAMLEQMVWRKLKRILEQLEEAFASGHKVIVFAGRKNTVRMAEELVPEKVAKFAVPPTAMWFADGDAPPDKREEIRKEYMTHPGPCLLWTTGYAYGESVNLQDTDLLLITLTPYDPRSAIQWEGRVCRLGGTRKPIVRYLIAQDSVEKEIANSLIDKLPEAGYIRDDSTAFGLESALDGLPTGEDLLNAMLAGL